jgi:hypothetical protein
MPWKSIVLLGKSRVRFMSSKNTESAKNEASPECFFIPHGIAGDSAKAIVGLRPSFSAHVRLGERGAPVRFPLALLALRHTICGSVYASTASSSASSP